MRITEFLTHQRQWEQHRGIVNNHHGLDRIRKELDEAYEAKTENELFGELIDVFIIASGSLAQMGDGLGYTDQETYQFVAEKLAANEVKYPKEVFEKMGMEAAVALCRAAWRLKQE